MKYLILFICVLSSLASCVSKKSYMDLQTRYNTRDSILVVTREDLTKANLDNNRLEEQLNGSKKESELLRDQIGDLKNTNNGLMERVSELSKMSQAGLETLKDQNQFIKDLTQKIQQKDSVALVLVTNLKRSLDDVNDKDINIKVIKGVVYISLSDNLLFRSGSSEILPDAQRILGKVAKIVKDHQELQVLVEGHTDNRPISNSCVKDNWDLSAKRATQIVRVLQWKFDIKPQRMTAGGRSQYAPKASNSTAQGRSANRRTEIILTPELDQFYDLFEAQDGSGD